MSKRGNIFLVGPMGAGKTTLGRALAKLRGLRFVDSDHDIEQRCGVDIPCIFELEGEAGFRKRERGAIAVLTRESGIVLATGGGAVLDAQSRRNLADNGLVVYLLASVEQQLARTRGSTHRPLLKTPNPRERLEILLAQRDPLYREIADLVIPTHGRQLRRMAQQVNQAIEAHLAETSA
ncbi:MAG: shikimate kinase AroK [Nevskiales bacterium]